MHNAVIDSLSLVDLSGQVIIAAIFVSLVTAVSANLSIRRRYAVIGRDLDARGGSTEGFAEPVLKQISDEARSTGANVQAIVEHAFQVQLKPLLAGERFVRSSVGLMITLGLVGTFYGLTLSIGKLVALVSTNGTPASDVAGVMTTGLTQALSGMAVAFTTSLAGIVAAIIMTVFGIVSNVGDRRIALMVAIEHHFDRAVPAVSGAGGDTVRGGADLDRMVARFGASVGQLESSVTHFEAALDAFSSTTRDFHEFNLHLKDNVQRMSLSFGDLSDTLKEHVKTLKASERT